MRRLGVMAALAPLGACALWHDTAASVSDAACPSVTHASAWVDHMPRIGSSPDKLIVALKIDDDRPWLLTPIMSSDPARLILEMSPGGPAFPGNAGYRETVSEMQRNSVSIMCGGKEQSRIEEITVTM
ncbi:hypothetical protein [Hyphomonas chukchiensis]|uniref:hypothetical protein n=1 Tax=Hyphomonas chukchiensis TaxID=1280947 RepID=UPI0030F59002